VNVVQELQQIGVCVMRDVGSILRGEQRAQRQRRSHREQVE
jgi:hypothetical protein